MKAQATTLYPFVPSGPNFTLALDFFRALGFEKTFRVLRRLGRLELTTPVFSSRC